MWCRMRDKNGVSIVATPMDDYEASINGMGFEEYHKWLIGNEPV